MRSKATDGAGTQAGAPGRERLALWMLRGYKLFVSPLLSTGAVGQCKYLPTCSEYAYVAVVRHGWWRGSRLALARLARCHPWSPGGADPVP